MTHPLLQFAPEVAQALASGRPVVALESTIISHGMPYPDNVAMAREVEAIVREGERFPRRSRSSTVCRGSVSTAPTSSSWPETAA